MNRPYFHFVFWVLFLIPYALYATTLTDTRGTRFHQTSSHIPYPLLPESQSLPADDYFYKEYYAGNDSKIMEGYQTQWSHHNKEMQWHYHDWNNEHYSEDRLGQGTAPRESDLRSSLANSILRSRLEATVTGYYKKIQNQALVSSHKKIKHKLENLKSAIEKPIEQVKNFQISAGSKKDPITIHCGYDIMTDNSHFEVRDSKTVLHINHPKLLSAPGKLNLGRFSIARSFSSLISNASISYPLDLSSIQTVITKPLMKQLSSNLSYTRPFRHAGSPHQYNIQLTYTF